LFFSELAGSLINSISTIFNNTQTSSYWSGKEFAEVSTTNIAWGFDNLNRYQLNLKTVQYNVWAVSPGKLAAVPLPGAIWLMGNSLLGFMVAKRITKKLC
jgi:hypothetical protein